MILPDIEPFFFTTSQLGQPGPSVGKDVAPVQDANDIESLSKLDVIVTCRAGDNTRPLTRNS